MHVCWKIYSSVLRVDQSLLTGESVSVNKSIEAIEDAGAVKQDQNQYAFSQVPLVCWVRHVR